MAYRHHIWMWPDTLSCDVWLDPGFPTTWILCKWSSFSWSLCKKIQVVNHMIVWHQWQHHLPIVRYIVTQTMSPTHCDMTRGVFCDVMGYYYFYYTDIVHCISDGNIFIKPSQDKNKTQWVSGSWFMRSLHWISAKSLICAVHSWDIWLRSNSGISSSRSTH